MNKATKYSKLYAFKQGALQVAREAHITGREAAKSEIVVNAISNVHAYVGGDIDAKDAMKNIAKDGIISYADGALSAGIRNVAKRTGVKVLAKSNVAAAIASVIIDAGGTVYCYAKGKISAEETAERLGETGCSSLSGIYVGSAAGAIFGVPGALLGSIAGYMLAASVYQSCIVIIKEAQLAEKEAERIENICIEAAKAITKQREEFEAAIAAFVGNNQVAFDECFRAIDQALDADQPIETIHALSNLTIRFGKELQLTEFENFDEFMMESDDPLVL